MDINLLRAIATVVSFVVFVGLLLWAWCRRNSEEFIKAANLPFEEEQRKLP